MTDWNKTMVLFFMLSVVTWEGWRHTRYTLIRVNLWNLFFSYSLHSTKNEPLLDRPQGLCVCGENVGCRAQLKNTILQSVWIKAYITHKCSNIRSYILSCIHTNTRIMGERFIYKTLFSGGLMWCYLIWDVMRAKHKRFFYCHRHSSINEKNTEVPKMVDPPFHSNLEYKLVGWSVPYNNPCIT